MKQNGIRLLSLLTGTELMLATAGLVAAVMLITSTSRLHELSQSISSAVESVYAAEQAERALLVHTRRSYLYGVTGQPEHLHQRDLERHEFDSSMMVIRMHIGTERERQIVKEAEDNAAFYFKRSEELERQKASPEQIMTALAGPLEDAQDSLAMLVQINYEQAQSFQHRVTAEDAIATWIGAFAALGVVLVLGGAFLLLDRYLRRPLLHLKQKMQGLDAGKLSRIEPKGPAELREIATIFNALIERLQQQRELQLRFLAGIAHDLRTPLNAIKLSADVIDGDNLDQEQRETLGTIERQVRQLDHQVGDLLDTTRIESGQLSLKRGPQDLGALLENTVRLFRGLSERHRVMLSLPDDRVITECDPTRISQVLNNLLSNAIKYSPSGGEVHVTLSRSEKYASIEVKDEGIGIAPEDLPYIFEPFRRTASTRDTIPGVGLGLSVAKRIIEAHGGSVQVSSTRGAGSSFILRLPLGAA